MGFEQELTYEEAISYAVKNMQVAQRMLNNDTGFAAQASHIATVANGWMNLAEHLRPSTAETTVNVHPGKPLDFNPKRIVGRMRH